MKTILFLSNAPAIELVCYFEGISAVGQREHWNLQRIGGISHDGDVKDILSFWKPDGCIIQNAINTSIFPRKLFTRIPHVFIDMDPAICKKNDLCVLHDSASAGRLAAHELLTLQVENFAYVRAHSSNPFWCLERLAAFTAAIKMNGIKSIFVSEAVDSERNATHRMLKHWLMTLPKPVGVFASNDRTAELVILAANELNIQIPTDLAVISVDNCEGICENSSPTITSIAPEFRQAGWLAADLLARRLADGSLKGVTLRYGQTGIVRRESTRRLPTRNARINRIIEYLRLHAAEADFSFNRIAEIAGCSLRSAEMHFKKMTGKTIHDELTEQRVERAKLLLRQSDHQVKHVGTLCGFASVATFFRNFTALVGMSPRDYRERQSL